MVTNKKITFDNVLNHIWFLVTSDQQNSFFINYEIGTVNSGPWTVMYNDLFYGADLEVRAFGTFSIQITDAERFVRNFLPANVSYYTFDSLQARSQIVTEFYNLLL